jgi:hypothetical protein
LALSRAAMRALSAAATEVGRDTCPGGRRWRRRAQMEGRDAKGKEARIGGANRE